MRKSKRSRSQAVRSPSKKRSTKQPAGTSKREALIENLKDYVRSHAAGFLKDPNITSVGIGYKKIKGARTPQIAVQFSVRTKVKPEDVSALNSSPIPKTLEINGTTVPTDVIERSYRPSYKTLQIAPKDERRSRLNTVRPGVSLGCTTTSAGTLGTFARDRQTGQIVLLSNWHVLHGSQGRIGHDVLQPGRFDDNRIEQNILGKLLRSHLGPAGDCAVASISGRSFTNDILGLGVACRKIAEAQLDDRVVKSGRTTGVTYGIVTRLEVNTKMTYQGGETATIGGFEIEADPKKPAKNNVISRGGDSGSIWLAVGKNGKATDTMLGLHFAGDDDEGGPSEFALACYAKSVMTKLELEPAGAIAPHSVAEGAEEELRQGFDQNFLSFHVPLPRFSQTRGSDLAKLDGDDELKYCHFSAWLSKRRKYPICVAWNINGDKFKHLNRVSFRTDRRGDLEEFQLTNDIYVNNVLDKGHIARRADLCWGTKGEAKQGNYDSFFYTNICPQHEAFNQSDDRSDDPEEGLWGRLENTVFDSENPHDLMVSVWGGPVFSTRDRKFTQNGEDCFLPHEFWKVVAYVDDDDGKEKVFAFILTQAHLVEGLTRPQGLDFEDWLWARITLRDLQEKTGVIFPKALKDREVREVRFVRPQTLGQTLSVKPLLSPDEYFT